jgi:hypothetical protein
LGVICLLRRVTVQPRFSIKETTGDAMRQAEPGFIFILRVLEPRSGDSEGRRNIDLYTLHVTGGNTVSLDEVNETVDRVHLGHATRIFLDLDVACSVGSAQLQVGVAHSGYSVQVPHGYFQDLRLAGETMLGQQCRGNPIPPRKSRLV